MSVKEIADQLNALRTNEIKNGWTKKVTNGDETFGLNLTTVQKFAKKLKTDPFLADELYAGDNHDLKVLATYIDDPESYTQDELSARINQIYPSPFGEKFCEQVVAKTPFAVHFIDLWQRSEDDNKRCFAYNTLASIAMEKNTLGVEFFNEHVNTIAKTIKKEPRQVRKAMYKALLNIGCRDNYLRNCCLDAARRVGLIRLDGRSSVDLLTKIKKTTQQRKPVFA
jgi:hypothetical protein